MCITGPDDEVTASSLAVEMDIHLDTLVLLAVLVLAVAACVLGWYLIGGAQVKGMLVVYPRFRSAIPC